MLSVDRADAASVHISSLAKCLSPASFWMPELADAGSPWISHAPFAFWLVEALRPRLIVELGVSRGHSYAAFCQAVRSLNLDTRCCGVDTWEGDSHTGSYENAFLKVRKFNDAHNAYFSELMRSDFDEALPRFAQGSIDLLHINDVHAAETVCNDFNNWRSRISNRGVVLFHDINGRERGSGVAEVWNKLRRKYPHFEFWHGNGLGVLGVGRLFPDPLAQLFDCASDSKAAQQIRLVYSRLGLAIADRIEHTELTQAKETIVRLQEQLRHQSYLAAVASQRAAEVSSLFAQVEELSCRLSGSAISLGISRISLSISRTRLSN